MTDWSEPREWGQAARRIQQACLRILGEGGEPQLKEVVALLWGIASAAAGAITLDMSYGSARLLLDVALKALTRIKILTGDMDETMDGPFQPNHDVEVIQLQVHSIPLLEADEASARAAHRANLDQAYDHLSRLDDQATTDVQRERVAAKEADMFAEAMMAGSAQRDCRELALGLLRKSREKLEEEGYVVKKLPNARKSKKSG